LILSALTMINPATGWFEMKEIKTKVDYGIKSKIITTRNPQANAIVERMHQTIGNMIRTFELYDNGGTDDDDPRSGILAAVMAEVQSTYSTTTQATPMQLVFGRNAIINTKFLADWNLIRQRKQYYSSK
jgi:hypothetical protein